jgi:hypothetical protein
VWGAAVGGGVTIGPLVGAGLEAAIGWRSGFWIEAAGAAAVMTAPAALTESRTSAGRSLDLPGIVASSTWMRFVPGLVIVGAGAGIVNGALGRIAVESVPPR